ncbi:hypothetical protein ELH26_12080 [Rhizobium leguminosarum]|uniref:hypothetical protein n=1 Tax=Rhizobium leguminosarum TaxID=384 RepID=UPI00102F43CA|nr:hypothetical protein [Rhizobium leguminosarum]TBC94717.1 hypothetical protein ELH26_12080 [Rhizobium leguminosarum]
MPEINERGNGLSSAKHFEERARATGSVLALSSDISPGEGLREAAYRASGRNAFRNTDILIELSRARSFRSLASVNEGAIEELDRLIDVLGIRKEAQQVQALLSNGGFPGKDWVRYFGLNIRRGHLAKGRRVAPRSLGKQDHQEAVWSLRPFGFDLKTKETLLDHCPACLRGLGWRRTFGPAYCDRCPAADDPYRGGVYLPDFPQPLVEVWDEEAIAFEASLIDPAAPTLGRSLHGDLAGKDPSEVFQLSIEIATRLDRRRPGWGTALETQSIEKAARAILDWPEGLDELIDSQKEILPSADPALDPLERLHVEPKLSRNIRAILKERCDRRLQRRVRGLVRDPANKVVRSAPVKNALAEIGVLVNGKDAIPAAEAAVLLLRRSREANYTAKALGLPVPYLVDLFEAGLLPELRPLLDGILTLRSDDIISLLDKVGSVFERGSARDGGLPLWSAAFASAKLSGVRWAEIFWAFLAGRLRAELIPGRRGLVQRLHLADARNLDLGSHLQDSVSLVDEVSLTQGEISEAIGKGRRGVGDLVVHGVLPLNATGRDLADFRGRWMFTTEVRDLAILNGRGDLVRPRPVLAASKVQHLATQSLSLWSRTGVTELLPVPVL